MAAAAAKACDRFGFGWRAELAAGILANLDRIDVVEVIAEDRFCATRPGRRALRTLAAQLPIIVHGTALGLASTEPLEARRLDRLARLIEAVGAEGWSEHLAFVRGGGVEIGHLAAPPRTTASVEGACANLARAAQIVGAAPLVENIATLIAPPASTLSETTWISHIINGSGAAMLLDLHNLYANAVNFDADPLECLTALPLDRVASVHLSGGHWIDGPNGARRLLDDHVHDAPAAVYALLRELGRRVSQPLTVIIERDGRYPPIENLLMQLDRARDALAEGRAGRHELAAA